MYKVFVMLWVLVGLGYWVLVLNFLQKALKSKEVVAGLRQTSKLIAKEAEDIRQALVDAGILQRDAVFVPEHSKMTMSLMMNMSSMLAGGGRQPEAGSAAPHSEVRGIHSMGASLRSNSILSALMAAAPPAGQPGPASPAEPQSPAASAASPESGATLTPLLERRGEESPPPSRRDSVQSPV